MSLDLWLECEYCGQSGESFNYTYNVAPMWYAAVPDSVKMVKIEGDTGKQSLFILNLGIEALESDPKRFRDLNPDNGWDDYYQFLDWLRKLRGAAMEHP